MFMLHKVSSRIVVKCCKVYVAWSKQDAVLRDWGRSRTPSTARIVSHSWVTTITEKHPRVQGMGTALQRIGQNPEGTTGSGVSNDDPDLVAYWTFDEGRGYVVHDVTQRGHDLYLTSEPHWEVCSAPPTDRPIHHRQTLALDMTDGFT